MTPAEVETRIREVFPHAELMVEGADCSFSVTLIDDSFEKMRPVQRQQSVLALFNDSLMSGALHALTVNAVTNKEWAIRQAGGIQL